MPPVNLLIKPASGHCNLRCSYCFYADEISHREVPLRAVMDLETQEIILGKLFDYADGPITVCFQGGEPTLASLAFFKHFVANAATRNKHSLPIQYALQTNGMILDDSWASFFAKNKFLIGLSLDGPADIHDQCRVHSDGLGTFESVFNAAEILRSHQVEYNVLTVLTAHSAPRIKDIYRFFTQNGFDYQQYIPCLDPLESPRGSFAYSLLPEVYAQCMIDLFDMWYQDQLNGNAVYIRDFENLAGIILGYPAERCGMSGRCVNQFVIEANADVYPCDFYTLDPYCIGNLKRNAFEELEAGCDRCGFISASLMVHHSCQHCEWYNFCRGGCRRDRQGIQLHDIGLNYFCEANKVFFAHAIPLLSQLIRNLSMASSKNKADRR